MYIDRAISATGRETMIRKKISDKEAYLQELRNTLEQEELTIKVYRAGETPAIFQLVTRILVENNSHFSLLFIFVTSEYLTFKFEIRSVANGVWNPKVVYAS
jgi:hypothetical protein